MTKVIVLFMDAFIVTITHLLKEPKGSPNSAYKQPNRPRHFPRRQFWASCTWSSQRETGIETVTVVWFEAAAAFRFRSDTWGHKTFSVAMLCLQPLLRLHVTHSSSQCHSSDRSFRFKTPAVMWRITSLFHTAVGMFLEPPWAEDGLYVPLQWQPLDSSTKREKIGQVSDSVRSKVTVSSPRRRRKRKIRAGNLVRIKAPCQFGCNITLLCNTWMVPLGATMFQ